MAGTGVEGARPVSRRRFLSGVSLAGTGALLAACGGAGSGGGDAIAQGKSSREVTLRWSTWGDETNPFNQVAAPNGIKLFNQKFPKIKIMQEPQPSDWSTKNQTEWLAGTGPDISGHCCDWGPVWARQGLLYNMEPGMKKDVPAKIREDFVDWLMKLFHSPENGQFALPMYTGATALYYNKQSFQKAGVAFPDASWDWNKYREAATKLTNSGQGVYGRRLIAGYDRNMQRIHSNGGNWVDPKDDTKPAFDQAKAVDALRYEWDAAHKEKIAGREGGGAGGTVFPSLAGKTIYQAFSEGLYAMMEEGSWILARMTQENNIPSNVEWDVAPMPRGPVGRFTLATNDGWSIWKGGKSTDEAWEFVKFLMTDEWNEIASRDGGQQSGRKSFQDRWEKLFKENYPKLQTKNLVPFKEAITKNEARPIELFRKHADFARDVLPKLLNDSIRDGKTTVDAAVKETADLARALHK